jgi:hypothetical protein
MARNELGGGALAIGSLLVLLVLYRDPASGIAAGTRGLQPAVYFLVLPVLGLLAGLYAAIGGPYGTVLLFLLGTYVGVFGLALTLGGLLTAGPVGFPLVVGLALLPLSLLALVSSLLRWATSLGLDSSLQSNR